MAFHGDSIIIRERLLNILSADVITDRRTRLPATASTTEWIYDFKKYSLDGEVLALVSKLFWDVSKKYGKFQACGLETTAIGLVAGVVLEAHQNGANVHGIYIRKSRKKDDLHNLIEGQIADGPVVIFDDVINSGRNTIKQIEVLESIGKKVVAVVVVVRFRDLAYYRYLHEKGVKIISLFTLDDFPLTGGIARFVRTQPRTPEQLDIPFSIEWRFGSSDPYLDMVTPKSAPAIDEDRLYVGADNGLLWALDQRDGSVAWSFKTLFGAGKKRVFSSPACINKTVYFGSYDGNFYALDADTGTKKWVYLQADWIGSSPDVAQDLDLVFIGLEFGLFKKQGGIAALDAKTGAQRWMRPIETLVHSSPKYSRAHRMVVVGSSSGTVYAFGAKRGEPRWSYAAGGAVRRGFALDEKRGLVCFGAEDGCVYVLDIKSGVLLHKVATMGPIDSTPLVHDGYLYVGSTDKRVYCIDLKDGSVRWSMWTDGRVFASPAMIEGHLFVGSNDGRLYELDPATGAKLSFFQATERIVDRIAYNARTRTFFVPTHANEIYCIKRKELASDQPSATA